MYFIDYAITVVPIFFSPFSPSTLYSPAPLSSCPWVAHVSSLASPFPILFLTSHCLFCTYQLFFLFSVPFCPFSLLPISSDNPPRDLHFCDSFPVLDVYLVFVLGLVVDSCEFVVILLLIVFDLLFLR